MNAHLALGCMVLAVIPWWIGRGLAWTAGKFADLSGFLYDKACEYSERQ